MLQFYGQDHMKSYGILQYPRESYKIVQDPMGWDGYGILDKHERTPQHAVKILNSGIIQDPTGSLRILDKIQQNRYLF